MKKLAYFLLILFNHDCLADWTLSNKASRFNYFSSANNGIEVNSFVNLFGHISDQGKLVLKVDLNSIDTNNSNRNLYLQDQFLETKNFHEAELSVDLGEHFLDSLQLNKASQAPIQGVFVLHGVVQHLDFTLLLTRLDHNFLVIKTYDPVLLKLTDFGFSDGISRLQKLEAFKSITGTVPISLNLFFTGN